MISVADLLTNNRVPGNYFAPDAYVRSDLELGLLENRRGDRLLALPETLIQGIYAGLNKETGQASRLVLLNCGRWWGKNFYSRFREELTDYYGQALADMSMAEFMQCLQQCWATHGWGKIDLDQSYRHRGFLIVKVWNSTFAQLVPAGSDRPMCFLEAGILCSFFSQLIGKDLHCIQISCESMQADCNRFLLGSPKRLEPVAAMVENRLDHATILERLCS
jgi:predicted hydrocarbon binding protein